MGTILAMILVVSGAQTDPTEVSRFFEQVTVSVSTTRSTYFVAQPAYLIVAMRDTGDSRVRGLPQVWPYADTAGILYRKNGAPFREFRLTTGEVCRDVEMQALKPGQEWLSPVALAFDEEADAPLLDEPGVYVFQVVYTGFGIRGMPIESNVVAVEVVPLPSEHRDAARNFLEGGLSRLVQYDGLLPGVGYEFVGRAERFLTDYPDSPYTRDVWWGLLHYIGARAHSPYATDHDKRLFQQMSVSGEIHRPRFGGDGAVFVPHDRGKGK